jgi:hypothetical protein
MGSCAALPGICLVVEPSIIYEGGPYFQNDSRRSASFGRLELFANHKPKIRAGMLLLDVWSFSRIISQKIRAGALFWRAGKYYLRGDKEGCRG